MRNYVKPEFEYIELTVSEKVSVCTQVSPTNGQTYPGACPS
jgi:hypothetical protein